MPAKSRPPAAHVEDVAAELALHDQGGQLGLGFADAPWRSDSLPEGDGFTAVGGFELKIQRFSHVFIYINGLIYVNTVDIRAPLVAGRQLNGGRRSTSRDN